MLLDLDEAEQAALIVLLRGEVENTSYPLAPHIQAAAGDPREAGSAAASTGTATAAKAAGRAQRRAGDEAAMTARHFRDLAERLIIVLLVVAAIVVVVREPGRIIASILDPDPWSNIATIVLSGGIGWIFGWRIERDD